MIYDDDYIEMDEDLFSHSFPMMDVWRFIRGCALRAAAHSS